MNQYLEMEHKEFTQLIAKSSKDEVDDIFQQLEELVAGKDSSDYESDHDGNLVTKIVGKYTICQSAIYWNHQDIEWVKHITLRAKEFILQVEDDSSLLLSPVYYNLASFTLPWWSDSIKVTAEDQQLGFDSAELLLKLRVVNDDALHKLAGASWMLAAHWIYTKENLDRAIEIFEKGIDYAKQSEEEIASFMKAQCIEGIGRAHLLLGSDDRGRNYLSQARELYTSAEDDYSLGELEAFLNRL